MYIVIVYSRNYDITMKIMDAYQSRLFSPLTMACQTLRVGKKEKISITPNS